VVEIWSLNHSATDAKYEEEWFKTQVSIVLDTMRPWRSGFDNQVSTTEFRVRLTEIEISRFHQDEQTNGVAHKRQSKIVRMLQNF